MGARIASSEMRRVALVVDNPLRDLGGITLVAHSLARQGLQCFLVPFNLQTEEIRALAPEFVLLNYLRRNNQRFVKDMLAAGIRVGVLDTEGGVLATLESYETTLADDPGIRRGVGPVCMWGPAMADAAVQRGWFAAGQVVVTGTPRFDYYTARYRSAALQASPHGSAYRSPVVLINGNFPVANPRFYSPEQEARQLVDRLGYDPEFVRKLKTGQEATMRGIVEIANELSARFPEATFVYSPHPFERLETYHRLLRDAPNLHLVKAGTVDGWILRSAAVIQRGCSTAIEASLARVPALSPSWLPSPVEIASV